MGREKVRFDEIVRLLPEGWEENAQELGAFRRARKIKSARELLRLILLYLTEGKSFAGTSALLELSGDASLNKMAVFKRMRNSARWLQWLCENICRQAGLIAPKPAWLKKQNRTVARRNRGCKMRGTPPMLYAALQPGFVHAVWKGTVGNGSEDRREGVQFSAVWNRRHRHGRSYLWQPARNILCTAEESRLCTADKQPRI